jgi:hypothetical protein
VCESAASWTERVHAQVGAVARASQRRHVDGWSARARVCGVVIGARMCESAVVDADESAASRTSRRHRGRVGDVVDGVRARVGSVVDGACGHKSASSRARVGDAMGGARTSLRRREGSARARVGGLVKRVGDVMDGARAHESATS